MVCRFQIVIKSENANTSKGRLHQTQLNCQLTKLTCGYLLTDDQIVLRCTKLTGSSLNFGLLTGKWRLTIGWYMSCDHCCCLWYTRRWSGCLLHHSLCKHAASMYIIGLSFRTGSKSERTTKWNSVNMFTSENRWKDSTFQQPVSWFELLNRRG